MAHNIETRFNPPLETLKIDKAMKIPLFNESDVFTGYLSLDVINDNEINIVEEYSDHYFNETDYTVTLNIKEEKGVMIHTYNLKKVSLV